MSKMFWILFLLLLKENVAKVRGSSKFSKHYAELKSECLTNSKNRIHNDTGTVKCSIAFHGACWPETRANTTVILGCPEIFFYPSGNISRKCNESGQWEKANISSCVRRRGSPAKASKDGKGRVVKRRIRRVYVVTSWLSISIMFPSVVFTIYLLKGKNERFNVHTNLILAFILRIITFFIHHYGDLAASGHSILVCNIAWTFNRYFAAAEIMWMLNEALLLLRKVVIIFDKKSYMKYYMVIGWGLPFLHMTAVYVPTMLTAVDNPAKRCWTRDKDSLYMLVLYIPLALILLVNFCVLVYTVSIFVRRQKKTPRKEFVKLRKAVKGTLILSPLLGVIYLLMFFQPAHTPVWYDYVLRVLYPMQGTFACLVYVAFSREVYHKAKQKCRSSVQGRRSLLDNGYSLSFSRSKNPDKSLDRKSSQSSSPPSIDPSCQTRSSPACNNGPNWDCPDATVSRTVERRDEEHEKFLETTAM